MASMMSSSPNIYNHIYNNNNNNSAGYFESIKLKTITLNRLLSPVNLIFEEKQLRRRGTKSNSKVGTKSNSKEVILRSGELAVLCAIFHFSRYFSISKHF
ncbi:hypothetical protein QVD17_30250 [Tagetes erecta]|uniref:Uncharacterized protein n=1 Tax=Tagetes erecta TaxID=13708 RepID=A0AAD8K169_TARER|nr:hypothetical protein QVD17_30250 [Tagetes erecta]